MVSVGCMDAVAELVERARDAAVAAGRLLSAILAVADTAFRGLMLIRSRFALVWSSSAARGQVEFGRYLRDVIPDVFAALCAGVIDGRRAWVFYDVPPHRRPGDRVGGRGAGVAVRCGADVE